MNHTKTILDYLSAGNRLTTAQAVQRWRCYRLAARVNDLRNQGHPIETTMVTRNGKRYAVYSMRN